MSRARNTRQKSGDCNDVTAVAVDRETMRFTDISLRAVNDSSYAEFAITLRRERITGKMGIASRAQTFPKTSFRRFVCVNSGQREKRNSVPFGEIVKHETGISGQLIRSISFLRNVELENLYDYLQEIFIYI